MLNGHIPNWVILNARTFRVTTLEQFCECPVLVDTCDPIDHLEGPHRQAFRFPRSMEISPASFALSAAMVCLIRAISRL